MTTFSATFKPALNKSGFARCEYLGYEIKEGTKSKTDKNGVITENPWTLLSLTFDVRGVARGSSQKVNITCGLKYDSDNELGQTLKALGYTPPEVKLEVDEEGFEVESVVEDDEGFETSEDMSLGIEEFLETIEGKVFIAKLSKPTEGRQKGYWQIDYKTLKLM